MIPRRGLVRSLGAASIAGASGCLGELRNRFGEADKVLTPSGEGSLSIASPAFGDGEPIPERYTCVGRNRSPPLVLEGVPDEAAALALVVDDPDAPRDRPYVHWLLWNIPPDATELPENVPGGDTVDALGGARQGTNSAGEAGYSGPCPPRDHAAHTYRFMAYAIDSTLAIEPRARRPAVDEAIRGAAIASATLRGTFEQ